MKKRKVLLTGASRGIGRAIFDLIGNEYDILAPARQELDLNDNSSIDLFISKHHKENIEIIINNAGINNPQWIDEISDDNLKNIIQINLIAPIRLIRGFVSQMKRNKWGRIVNISSMFGIISRGKQSLYTSTKHGINGMTKALAIELGPYNILVNSVCPGFTKTDLLVKNNTPEKIKLLEQDVPLCRLAEPSEIAELVKFLISDRSSYITGTNILIDGGYSIK